MRKFVELTVSFHEIVVSEEQEPQRTAGGEDKAEADESGYSM